MPLTCENVEPQDQAVPYAAVDCSLPLLSAVANQVSLQFCSTCSSVFRANRTGEVGVECRVAIRLDRSSVGASRPFPRYWRRGESGWLPETGCRSPREVGLEGQRRGQAVVEYPSDDAGCVAVPGARRVPCQAGCCRTACRGDIAVGSYACRNPVSHRAYTVRIANCVAGDQQRRSFIAASRTRTVAMTVTFALSGGLD